MNIDIQRLIDHLHAGIPYHGDLDWEVLGLAKNAEILGYIRLI